MLLKCCRIEGKTFRNIIGHSKQQMDQHKFELPSSVVGMAKQEILIHSQNVVGCLKFLKRHTDFWHNQIFEPPCIYNKNEEQAYN